MENQPQPHKARRKNSQPVRSTTGEQSQHPQDPATQQPLSAYQMAAVATSLTRTTTVKEAAPEVSAAAPSTTVQPPVDDSESERIMREFLKKFGARGKASDVLARMAEEFRLQEEASQLAPLQIPPRPETLAESPTCRALPDQKDAHDSLPETSIPEDATVLSSDPPTSQIVDVPVDIIDEKDDGNAEGSGDRTAEGSGDRNVVGSGDRISDGSGDELDGNAEMENPVVKSVGEDVPVDKDDGGAENFENTKEEEEPAPSVPKRVKMNRPNVPQNPGSCGGQAQN